jgi:hypothetical protein
MTFTVDASGVFDNGDNVHCATSVSDHQLTLHRGGWPTTATWTVYPDGSIQTDVYGRLYGEWDPAEYRYSITPLPEQSPQ